MPVREVRCPVDAQKGRFPVWAALRYCFLMVSVEPMDALMMAERAAHWARLSCSPQASGERITGTPPLLLRMPDPGLHHGASWPCASAFRVSPVSAQSEPPAKRVVCSGPVRACYRLRLKTLAFTLFKPSALAALATP